MGKKKERDWATELERSFELWTELNTKGGDNPGYSDGANMNLIRNHILYYKDQLLRAQHKQLPEIYYKEIPPEVDNQYMAKGEEILREAKTMYCQIQASADYQFLLSMERDLDPNQTEQLEAIDIIERIERLKKAINDRDYIVMRRLVREGVDWEKVKSKVEILSEQSLPTRQLTWEDFIAS